MNTLQKFILSSPGGEKVFDAVRGRNFAFWLFFSLLYGQLALALIPTWSDGTYYDYGYLVPLLLPYLFLTRWKETAQDSETLGRSLGRIVASPTMGAIAVLCLAGITLCRLAQGADSGWRAPLYVHAFLVLGMTVLVFSRILGRSLLSFWPLAILVLLAVPLPSAVEFSLIHNLTTGVMDFALFYHRMMGLPLASSGETIFANGIPLHVSDGCSGIRSFQSGVFAGFVLGEFLRLALFSRLLLVAFGLGIAFLMNAFRVIYLVHHAVTYPGADLAKVHDLSGYVSLTATFLLIGGTGWLLDRIGKRLKAAQAG